MAGEVSSLGMGSGVLTANIIDKLKAADEDAVIKPIEDKLQLNQQKQKAESLLSSLMDTLEASTSSLGDEVFFAKRTADVSGSANVTVDAGTNIQSFSLQTTTLAKKDVIEAGSLNDKNTTTVGSSDASDYDGSETYDITVDGNTYKIPYDNTTTLNDLSQAINDKTNGAVKASILQTGNSAYNLVLTSSKTGSDQAITIEDSGGKMKDQFLAYDADNNPDGYQTVQKASDAEFKYNGIDIKRSSNDIDDLIVGVHIKLTQEGDTSQVDIKQDSSTAADTLQNFVDSYNKLTTNLQKMTTVDKEAKKKGVFSGDSFVKSIQRNLAQSILQRIDGDSLMNYGVSLKRDGTMTFDKSAFISKMDKDPESVKKFFTGESLQSEHQTTGFFTMIDDKLKNYTDSGKSLSIFESELKQNEKSFTANKTQLQASLDSRYEIMRAKFAAYDGIISKYKAQFASLQQIIDAQTKSK